MQQFIGRVIQSSRSNIAKVAVERSMKEKSYLKPFKVTKKYTVSDESNCASIGDVVEIVYERREGSGVCFKINQTVKEAQKYTNPVNGKIYSIRLMVLPWISDLKSPAVRDGLLGCPYFDSDSNEILFASDKKQSIGIHKSPFYKIRDWECRSTSIPQKDFQISTLRKSTPECFFPSCIIQNCTNGSDIGLARNNISNLLALATNSQHENQHYSIYPDLLKGGLIIDHLNEIELDSHKSALSLFDRNYIDFPFTVNTIKAHNGRSFLASSARNLRLYSYSKGSFCEVFEFSPSHDDQFSSVDICRNDIEICAVLLDAKKLIFVGENHKYEYTLSNDFSDCSYTSHPSIVALWGNSNKIELKDKRGAFTSITLFDQNSPIQNVGSLVAHVSDENLISISCSVDSHCRNSTSELRIYDIRYPKESTMRISSFNPVNHLLYLDSYLDERSDNLFGIDSRSNVLRWEFKHSKNNRQHMDGTLTLTDISKISQNCTDTISDDQQFVGQAISPSFCQSGAMFLTRLSNNGSIEYCTMTSEESGLFSFDPNDAFEDSGEILDFSHLPNDYVEAHQVTSSPRSRERADAFGCISQSTFHLDFYWEELKFKINQYGE